MNELCVRTVLARRGVDISRVRFREVPFPEMPAALQTGRVDAISAVEPFVSVARGEGARGLLPYFAGLRERMTVATYFATASYIETNADTVRRFARAMNRSLATPRPTPRRSGGSSPRTRGSRGCGAADGAAVLEHRPQPALDRARRAPGEALRTLRGQVDLRALVWGSAGA